MDFFVGIVVVSVIMWFWLATRGNSRLLIADPIAAINLSGYLVNARISVGVAVDRRTSRKEKGVFIYATKSAGERAQELLGTFALTEQQIESTISSLSNNSGQEVFWGPKKKISFQLKKNNTEAVITQRIIGPFRLRFKVKVNAAETKALANAFQRLTNAEASTIIEA